MSKIPGFRSGKAWKMALAGFVYGVVVLVVIFAVIDPPKDAPKNTEVNSPQANAKVYTVDEIKTELKRILVVGENKDKTTVAYKIRDVKQVGANEFTVMVYSDLGDATNFSGNTYQILEYINSELTQKINVQFFEVSIQYFKKINGESVRIYTYQIPKESIKSILDYGSNEGSPLTNLKKRDGITKETSL